MLKHKCLNKLFLSFTIIIICLFSSFNAYSQEHDFQIWTSLTADKEITKKFDAELQLEMRCVDNARLVGTAFTDAGIAYQFTKWLKISGNYRFILKRLDDGFYQNRHRFYCNFQLSHKTDFANYSFRTRYQHQFSDLNNDNYNTDNYIRNKFTFKPNIFKKFVTYISFESYHNIEKNLFFSPTDIRTEAGIEYKISKKQTFNPYFLFQRERRTANPEFDYVLGLNYIFSF